MRKTLFLMLILLAVSAWAVAQQDTNSQNAPSTSASSQATTQPADSNGVQGCLGGSGDNYTVTDKAGTTYQLQLPPGGDTSKLKDHIGNEVLVTGAVANAASGNASTAGSSTGQPSINVRGISKVSDTCNAKTPGAIPPPKGQ